MNVDTTILPDDVLLYINKEFYDLVEKLTSPNEAKILEIQQINSIHSFLLIKDLLEFINYDNADVQEIRDKICFKLSNNTFVIKPGVKSNIQYLTNLFTKKVNEQRTLTKRKRMSSEANPDEILSEEDLKSLIIEAIQRWCTDNEELLGLGEFCFRENEHYTITSIYTEQASITCKCNEKIRLLKYRGKFQLSNYYRHYKSSNCSMLKRLRKSQSEKENSRFLSTIAALPPANARALLLSSTQSAILPNQTTNKRRFNSMSNDGNDLESKSKQKKF